MNHYLAGVAGLEPADAGVKVPCLNRLGYTPLTPGDFKMAPRTGLEPVTYGLTVRRSTD